MSIVVIAFRVGDDEHLFRGEVQPSVIDTGELGLQMLEILLTRLVDHGYIPPSVAERVVIPSIQ